MKNININSLFGKNINNTKKQPLSVYSLYKDNTTKKVDFSIKELIEEKDRKERRINEKKEEMFQLCLKKIKKANKEKKVELSFKISKIDLELKDYNYKDYINYVDIRLRKLYMDTIIIDDTILISWDNIKKNLERNKKR